jgi:hypothetical protein
MCERDGRAALLGRGRSSAAAGVLVILALACGDGGGTKPSPTVTPSPTPEPGVIRGLSSGPTRITFVGADPPPGAAVPGCGASAEGCRRRVRIRLALQSPVGGPVLYVRVFLHDTGLRACLLGQTGSQVLRPGQAEELEVLLDEAGDCRTPADIRTMAAVVEGTVEVASRQEWGIRYTLMP